MTGVLLIIVLAIIIEAIIEYAKSIARAISGGEVKTAVTQITAIVISISLCFAAGADLFEILGIDFNARWIGTILTGLFISRGANYASDFIKKIQTAGSSEAT